MTMPLPDLVGAVPYHVSVSVEDGRVVVRATADGGARITLALTPAAAVELSLLLAEATRAIEGRD